MAFATVCLKRNAPVFLGNLIHPVKNFHTAFEKRSCTTEPRKM